MAKAGVMFGNPSFRVDRGMVTFGVYRPITETPPENRSGNSGASAPSRN